MRAIKLFLMFAIFVGFMLGGIFAAGALTETENSTAQTVLKPNIRLDSSGAAPNGQRNILLIGVDQLDSQAPRLEGLWLLMNVSSSNRITLLPLYPAPPGKEVLDTNQLISHFRLDLNGNPDPDFLTVIQQADFWWSNYFVLDQAGLAQLIDYNQGINLGGGPVGGSQAVASLASASTDGLAALNAQSLLIQAICNQQSSKMLSADLRQVFSLLSGHYQTDLRLKTLISEWQRPLINSGQVMCEFPTLASGQPSSASQ
jgi:hypothetical protein